ncbi:hypothetical protein GOODEAATRI_018066 [Goodea atripinnis]|uniref:PH domain-containing protein n=1 Tax=Goodea atripinnis TaxID=208336 RepID=A0ABV0MLS9_9TELE
MPDDNKFHSYSLVHSGPDRGSPCSGTELFFATRTGTRLGIETHLFRAETTKDLSLWTRHIVNGCHTSAEMIKEVTTSEFHYNGCYIIGRHTERDTLENIKTEKAYGFVWKEQGELGFGYKPPQPHPSPMAFLFLQMSWEKLLSPGSFCSFCVPN